MDRADTETKAVVVEREIPHPPEKIWRALTQPHLLQEWLMKNDFKPEVGHQFQLKKEAGGYDIVIDCKVLAVEPHKRLSYEWDYIVGDPTYDTRSVVTFTLTPKGNGTHLRVEQSGFRSDQRRAWGGARASWTEFFEGLEKLLSEVD